MTEIDRTNVQIFKTSSYPYFVFPFLQPKKTIIKHPSERRDLEVFKVQSTDEQKVVSGRSSRSAGAISIPSSYHPLGGPAKICR